MYRSTIQDSGFVPIRTEKDHKQLLSPRFFCAHAASLLIAMNAWQDLRPTPSRPSIWNARRLPQRVPPLHASLPDDEEQQQEHHPHLRRVNKGLLAIAALGVSSCTLSPPASAWGETWRPRRHHRRLGQWDRAPDLGKYTPVCLSSP